MLGPDERDAIVAAFGLGEALSLAGPVARGEQGQVWRLETTRGTWAVKETFEPLSEAEVAEAAAFQEAAALAGVATPRIARTSLGDVLHACGETHVRLYEWVDLEPPDRLVDPDAVGRLLAAIHLVGFEGRAPVHPWYTDPVGATRWRELAAALAEAGGPQARGMASLCEELIALEGLLEPPRSPTTCHRDLWADNVLATQPGGLCVIDWDNCGLADQGQEVALALCEFGVGDPARVRGLYRSYVEAGGPGRVSDRGDFSMVIAQLGHLGEMAIAAWLAPDTRAAERDRQALRIEEFVSTALSRAAIDGVLNALTDG
jgi:aminoglycoside phosphotransferase (APT) family kinase protein